MICSALKGKVENIEQKGEKMDAKQVPEVMLNSGHKMPIIGFGTALAPPEGLAAIIADAIDVGYRHFDTASASFYGTEEALGKALAAALNRGLINSRQDFFITSKLWCSNAHPNLVVPALKASLQ